METKIKLAAVALTIIVIVSAVFVTNSILTGRQKDSDLNDQTNSNLTYNQTSYVGVTYCGDSVDDAKLLIDKVKNLH